MKPDPITRRLVAIVVADVVGYTRLMERNESGTHARLKEVREQLIDPKIAEYGGRIVKTAGDGMLLEFGSAGAALRCAVDVQTSMAARNRDLPSDARIEFRIGINLGDIIIDGNDVAGDGVNVAARLETLAETGGICVSQAVRDQVRDDLGIGFTDIGEQQVKNIARPIRVFRVTLSGDAIAEKGLAGSPRPKRVMRDWRWWAVGIAAVGIVGVGISLLVQVWKPAPGPVPPALSVAILPLFCPAAAWPL